MFPKLKNVVTLVVTDILSRVATRGESYAREFWLWALCSSGGSMMILQVMGVLKFLRFLLGKILQVCFFEASRHLWLLNGSELVKS